MKCSSQSFSNPHKTKRCWCHVITYVHYQLGTATTFILIHKWALYVHSFKMKHLPPWEAEHTVRIINCVYSKPEDANFMSVGIYVRQTPHSRAWTPRSSLDLETGYSVCSLQGNALRLGETVSSGQLKGKNWRLWCTIGTWCIQFCQPFLLILIFKELFKVGASKIYIIQNRALWPLEIFQQFNYNMFIYVFIYFKIWAIHWFKMPRALLFYVLTKTGGNLVFFKSNHARITLEC